MKQIKLALLVSTALLWQNLEAGDATPPKKTPTNAWGSRGAGRGRGQGATGKASSLPEQMVMDHSMDHSPVKLDSPRTSAPEAGVAAPGGISPADPVVCAHEAAAVCAGAGAGAGETDGFEVLAASSSASPVKDLPVAHRATWVAEPDLVFTGAQPDIRKLSGEYKPNMLASLTGYNFVRVLDSLKNETALVDREVEKTFSEMSAGLIDPKTAATITTGVEKTGIPINLHYWGNAFNYHEGIKTAEIATLLASLRETGKNIRTAKTGVVSALTGHSKQSGTGRTSPISDYGMGERFTNNEEEATIQLVRKAFALERAAAEAAKAAGTTKK